jgi:hypothetical protein
VVFVKTLHGINFLDSPDVDGKRDFGIDFVGSTDDAKSFGPAGCVGVGAELDIVAGLDDEIGCSENFAVFTCTHRASATPQ